MSSLRDCRCTGPVLAIVAREFPRAFELVADRVGLDVDADTLDRWRALCRESQDRAALALAMWVVGGVSVFGETAWRFSPATIAAVRRACGPHSRTLGPHRSTSARVTGLAWSMMLEPRAQLPSDIETVVRAELALQ